ncbi:MAG: hypothetical protein M3Z24_10955, partial [Chloroflexota bacterium]|nr:hypothetical protein [Chloroflexota bacterium]
MAPIRVRAYSSSIAAAVAGSPQRGTVHSVFNAAANILFPNNFVLSLNAVTSPRMPNGLQLSACAASFPFSTLQTGMPVLLGAQRLHIEAIGCSLDLSYCPQWEPFIEQPEFVDRQVIKKNRERLGEYVEMWRKAPTPPRATPTVGADSSSPVATYRLGNIMYNMFPP